MVSGPLRDLRCGWASVLVRRVCLFVLTMVASAVFGGPAFAASAGCDAVNAGALDSSKTTASGSITKSTGSVQFSASEVVTITLSKNSATAVVDMELSSLPAINNQIATLPADGAQLSITVPSNGSYN